MPAKNVSVKNMKSTVKIIRMPKKKTKKKKATGAVAVKHKAVLKNVGKCGSVKQAAKEAGYSESYAKNGGITGTKTWDEIVEETFSDDKVATWHEELMNAVAIQHYVFPVSESDDDIIETLAEFGFKVMRISHGDTCKRAYFPIVNTQARKAALDMIYKIKKRYDTTVTLKKGIRELSDAEVEGIIAEEISAALESIAGEGEEEGQ